MNMPIESMMWRKCAEIKGLWIKGVCGSNPLRYGLLTGYLSSGPLEQNKRGIKCTKLQFWRPSPQYSGYPHVTARWWISAQSTAQRSARAQVQLARSCWTVIRSKAPLLVALLVQLPAKTNSFGSNLSFGCFTRDTLESFNSFISPLLSPLRASVWGSFSCLHVSEHECPAHSENSRSIKGVAYV